MDPAINTPRLLPSVTLSWGQTLDGRLATLTGDSQWIGGPEALHFAQELRRDHEAILVGIGTVLADDPRLTCRLPGARQPVRVVLDAHLRTPPTAAICRTAEAPTLVFCGLDAPVPQRRALEDRGVEVVALAAPEGRLAPEAVLEALGERGLASVFVEGGSAVLTSFLRGGWADRVYVVTAPFLLGAGIEAVGDLGVRVLAQAPRPRSWRRWDLGDDQVTELVYR